MIQIVADRLNLSPMPYPHELILTLVFAIAILGELALRFWLASRQARHVAKHSSAVPSAFAGSISLQAHQKAASYTLAKTRFGLLETAVGAAILLGWTLLGGLDALNRALVVMMGHGLSQQLALLTAFALIGSLIHIPLELYHTFVIEQRFGFNRTSIGLWCQDQLKSVLLALIIGLPLAALVLWVMSITGPWWWLWAWGIWAGFNLLLLVIYPSFIAPLFNKFKPLEDETIKSRVNALMQRCGFSAKGLFVMDGSRRSAHANAYFTGFGASKRVVFYDTLLSRLTPDEVDAVLAHELGHFKRRHILKRIVSLFGLSLAGLAVLGWLSSHPWFYLGLGVTPNLQGPNDALALLLFILAGPVFGFFITPIFAWLSRRHEYEADAYAAGQTNGNALASALVKLIEDNASTLTPDPVYVAFYYSHPPATERLARLSTA